MFESLGKLGVNAQLYCEEWATYQHIPNQRPRCNPHHQTYCHSREDGDDSFVNDANSFDLEVVRCPEGYDKEYANDEE